jgi:hypothetical protein
MKIEDKQESSTSGKKAQEQVLGLWHFVYTTFFLGCV